MSGVDRAAVSADDITARVVVQGSDGSTRIVAGVVGELPVDVEYGPSECACGAEFCGHERTVTPRRGVDRAALIEAAVAAYDDRQCSCAGCLSNVVDAVLPLVAQAIEATADSIKPDRAYIKGLQDGRYLAARLVRSLAEEGQQQ